MIINPSYQAPKSYNNQVFRPAMRFRETGFDSVSFKGIAPVLKRETVLSAESVAEAYKSIMEILSRKRALKILKKSLRILVLAEV